MKDVKNYRCIVGVDTFSKLYWHLVNTRIVEHSKKHNLVNTLRGVINFTNLSHTRFLVTNLLYNLDCIGF